MSVKQVKNIDVRCPQGANVSIPPKDWSHEIVEREDKSEHGMGIATHHRFSVDGYGCPYCGREIDAHVDVWEYPDGVIETIDPSNVSGNVGVSFIAQMD